MAPYAAPEVIDGETPTPASDQYSLAAITYEWLFGKPVDGLANRPVDVKAMPGIDRIALARAFSRALSAEPDKRFTTCTGFCDALAAAVEPELPLSAFDAGDEADSVDPVEPFLPESAAPNVDDVKIVAEETNLTAAQPDFDAIDASIEADAVPSWNTQPVTPVRESQRFSGTALILAVLVGAVFGFAAGYMARPRALQTRPVETFATPPGADNPAASEAKPAEKAPVRETATVPAPEPKEEAPKIVAKNGRLLVRSLPSGATVSVDGVEKGVTPLALRDLDYGAINLTIARNGYVPESRRVVITSGRPSRSLDVRLAAAAPPKAAPKHSETAPRPSTPATLSRTGTLNVDSRPAGANVLINGKASGKTPITIDDLPPGEYRVVMTMPGYHNFSTTVRVIAGERVRAAASLTAQEQE